jgi:outer membrane biosynthesis protein TonB
VDGIVKGARIVKKEYMSDGSVEMLVAMSLKGEFMNVLVPESFGKPSFGQTPQKITPTPQKTVDLKPTPSQPQPSRPVAPPLTPEKPAEPPKPPVPAPSAPEKKPEPAKPSLPPAATVPDKKIEPPKQPEPSIPGTPSPEASTVAFKGGKATGLVIDGRGLGLRPALLPKIVDTQGQEIYVAQVVTRTNAVEQGVAGYAKDVNAASNNFRVTDNPAVIKGLRSSGSGRSDIVVGQADAQILKQLSSKGDFLQYCRVIIVY